MVPPNSKGPRPNRIRVDMPANLEDIFEKLAIEERLDDGPESIEAVKELLELALKERVDEIWDDGLQPRSFDILVRIFTDVQSDKTFRCLILDCLVPIEVISDKSTDQMIFWVICNCHEFPIECAEVLRWLTPMVRFNMVNPESIDRRYNELLKRLQYPLVKGLSEILRLAAKPVFMTKSNINLLEKFCEDQLDDVHIKKILGEYAKHVPHLVDRKYHFVDSQVWGNGKSTDFDKVVLAMSIRARVESSRQVPTHHILCRDLPSIEYQKRRKDENLKKIGEVKSMIELGRALERLQMPTNELALLQKEEGIMMIIVNGPSHNFLTSLAKALLCEPPTKTIIAAISGLLDLLSYGLPPVTPFLSNFLICWDGTHNEEYVYSLLPKLYFHDFKELKRDILDHLMRVFVSSSVETKVKILDSLLLLITHMIAVDRRRGNVAVCQTIPSPKWIIESDVTIASVIEYVIEMWKQGLILDGPKCTLLILKSILFYQKLNTLILQCGLPLFFVIHQSLSCSALIAKNHVVLNELCLLILQYKQSLIPLFEQKGWLGEYELEVESVLALSDSTFKYLWECVGGERPENFHMTQDEFTPNDSIGLEHLGLYPFLSGIAKEIRRNPREMTKNELMSVLESFISGVAEFIKYEEHDQLRH
ncbi:hypothetical protein GE061_009164 [Apolygus lucorum]|uniref:Centromere protein I n=1 Tax=Apolygus lucorum TaxID=248454 RepID=A0A8S9Y1I6_APOLU|nr:hypothetical protein GE061_009164 [Apolygus lucorum]